MTYPTVVGFSHGTVALLPGDHHPLPIPSGSVGDLLLIIAAQGRNVNTFTWPAGWTSLTIQTDGAFLTGKYEVRYRVADGSEGSTVTVDAVGDPIPYHAYRFSGYSGVPVIAASSFSGTSTPDPPNLTSGFGAVETLWIAGVCWTNGSENVSAYPSGYTNTSQDVYSNTAGGAVATGRKQTSAASENPGTFTMSVAVNQGPFTIGIEGVADFVADFTGTPLAGDLPLTVAFTDASHDGTGTPDAWSWDFGAGETSTFQDPDHTYLTAGTYTVTLTVTTDDAETDSETKVAYVTVTEPYIAPEPSLAVIEIKASVPGAARWGIALWGESEWSATAWQDVTPQSVDASVRWGSHRPEAGILTEVEAATWIVNTYDPERILDPGNPNGPYVTDLRAGLPIRIRHRGTIVRQGVAETIAFYHKESQGGIRVTDNLSLMARTPVPADSVLSDTLRARARDVISAAGLSLTVEPDPPTGDPALAPRIEGDRSVWRHISDAAQSVLNIAYIDRIGTIKFRPWDSPYDRGRSVDDTQLVDLGTVVSTQGLYSVIQAQQTVGDGGDLIERRLTPTPRYGAIVYTRSEETPDADAWADAVLADRSLQGIQWIPGEIFPLTADDVEYFATLEGMERLGVRDAAADPAVDITGIIVGGSFNVTSKRDDAAVWSFELELAQTADTPLYGSEDPLTFVSSSAGDEYVYPS